LPGERLRAGAPGVKRRRAEERPEKSPVAGGLSGVEAVERWRGLRAARRRHHCGRWDPAERFSLDQHSPLRIAIERLSDWDLAASWINALEPLLWTFRAWLGAGA